MKCIWYDTFENACANGSCPYRRCPTSEHPEVCKYSENTDNKYEVYELVKILRCCSDISYVCEECPANLDGEDCDGRLAKLQAADMLEKLAAEKGTQKPEWISVKDSLPERDRKVLVIDGHNGIRILAFWRKNGNEWEWITETYGISRKNDVKMWMPLPEPPKEEER